MNFSKIISILLFCLQSFIKCKIKNKKLIRTPVIESTKKDAYDVEPDEHTTSKIITTNLSKPKKNNVLTKQIHALKAILQGIRSWEKTTYEEMSWLLRFLNTSCEPYSHLYSIGSSVQNRELWVLAISDNPEKHEIGEPEVKIVANIHGNENVGREVILHMVDYICSKIDSDPEMKTLIENVRIHFFPSLNPDGFEMARLHGDKGKNIGRLNANGIDLNRNFPDQFFPSFHDPEPETLAVIKWLNDIPFMLSAALHDGAFVVSYPFDDSPSGQTKYSATPDDDIFRYLSRLYAETHPEMHLSNMGNCSKYSQHKKFIGGITNGAEWSSLSNTMQDYNYVQTNCFEITVEMSCITQLNETTIKTIFQQNLPSLLAFIRQGLRGIKGVVTDSNNNPLKDVHISISDRKHDIKTAENGDYWRLVLPGTYEVTARLRGYESSTRIVTVENSMASWVNFTLNPSTPDPTINTLGHVSFAQKSLNLMLFESDGRDSAETDNKEEVEQKNDTGSERENEELDDHETPIERKERGIPVENLKNKPKTILPTKIIQKPKIQVKEKVEEAEKTFKLNDLLTCQIPGRTENLEGKLKWIGSIPELVSHTNNLKNQLVIGLDLLKPDDLATDGTFLGKRYFTTTQNHAYFVPKNLCKFKKPLR